MRARVCASPNLCVSACVRGEGRSANDNLSHKERKRKRALRGKERGGGGESGNLRENESGGQEEKEEEEEKKKEEKKREPARTKREWG